MTQRRCLFPVLALVVLASSIAVLAQAPPNKDDKKKTDAQNKEIQNIVKMVDGIAAGQPAPNDLALTWVREDVLKAQGNKEYVPFTVTVDASKLSGNNVAFYWRVVNKNAAAAAAAPAAPADAKKDEKKDDKNKKTDYAYEDIAFVPVAAGQTPMRISRSFTVPAGSYDVYLIAKEPTPDKAPKNAPPPKASVVKHTVEVPDFWNGELATSSVIVAQRIDPLPAPLTPQQQADRPYALGGMEIVPAFETKFTKKSELSTFMLIYNPKVDSANKPDVSVEYNFYQKLAGQPEKFFNKTNPQNLNAQTLPPNFDFAAGHQLQSGQAVPLASFPEGDYRLEIKITDKIANKTLTREINFTVVPS
jgi:ribosomal protein L12E/L44/L45/RPP1/RPP2